MALRIAIYLASLGFALAVSGCSTATLTLQSSPSKAEIYLTSLGSGSPRLIGVTPLIMTSSELHKVHNGSGPISIELKKEGFSSVRTIITDPSAADLTVNLELYATSESTTAQNDYEKLNGILDSLFEGQRLARVGRQDDALNRLRSVQKDAPQIAASYELEGGIYYLQKKYKESLDAYTLATKYNPKSPDAIRMKRFLERSLGVQKTP